MNRIEISTQLLQDVCPVNAKALYYPDGSKIRLLWNSLNTRDYQEPFANIVWAYAPSCSKQTQQPTVSVQYLLRPLLRPRHCSISIY